MRKDFSKEWYDNYCKEQLRRKRDDLKDQRDRERPIHEERKNDLVETKKNHDRPQETIVDGEGDQKYSISIEFNVSDDRRRDLDGMCTTILDVLVHTKRRFLASSPPNIIECKKSKKG